MQTNSFFSPLEFKLSETLSYQQIIHLASFTRVRVEPLLLQLKAIVLSCTGKSRQNFVAIVVSVHERLNFIFVLLVALSISTQSKRDDSYSNR